MKLKTTIRDVDKRFRAALVPFARAARTDLLSALRSTQDRAERLGVIDQWEARWRGQATNIGNVSLARQYATIGRQIDQKFQKAGVEPPPSRYPQGRDRENLQALRTNFISSTAAQARDLAEVGASNSILSSLGSSGVRRIDRDARRLASRAVHVAATSMMRNAMEDVGVDRFVWVTSKDSRVRREHRELQGKVFRLDRGAPGVGLPGQDFGCRCTMELITSGS